MGSFSLSQTFFVLESVGLVGLQVRKAGAKERGYLGFPCLEKLPCIANGSRLLRSLNPLMS